ncbi:MAG: glycosyltransferase family 4 protein [Clostridiales bacterium]|nr:glycosyltransferase family 4 protein [Clostridiales bacterium]
MNILLSSYSVNPYHGSEDGIGWHWTLELSKKFNKPNDKIYLLTKKYNKKATEKGIKEYGLNNVELVIVDVPNTLNWFREKHSAFHHMYYILWQEVAYRWAKNSKIKFDIIHHVTMGDFRIPGKMYKFKDAVTIFGPVGGGQSAPKSLKKYENHKSVEKFREIINNSRAYSLSYKRKISQFNKVYAINKETAQIISKAMGNRSNQLPELATSDEFLNLKIDNENYKSKNLNIVYLGRLIHKKGLLLLIDVMKQLSGDFPYCLTIYGGGYLEDELKNLIEQNHLGDRVRLGGSVKHTEVSKIYGEADIFIMPSLRETSSNVMVEALAHKVPVIALDMSFASILKEKQCGLFINTEQSANAIINDFCRAITQLGTDSELRKQLGQNGYNYVNNELTWENKFNEIYGEIKTVNF